MIEWFLEPLEGSPNLLVVGDRRFDRHGHELVATG